MNQPSWWQLCKKITVLDLNTPEHQMLRVHVLVLPSTWDYPNLPEAPAGTRAFRSLLTGMEGRGREGNRWVLKHLQKEQSQASVTHWGNTTQRQDALRENTLPVAQAKSQLTADLSRTTGVSPSSGKHSVPWSLLYALMARAEPNEIFHPLKNGEVETENHMSM